MDLSIIIPAYNESGKIRNDINIAAQFLLEQKIKGEIIVVNDGSRDDTAIVVEKTPLADGIFKKLISYSPNRGKGYAVRAGMLASEGQYVMFTDTGHCTPLECALTGLALLRDDCCDIAHGSRKLPESKISRRLVWTRRRISQVFRAFVCLLFGNLSRFTDTQCGFKIYKGDFARTLYAECRTDGFSFDVEVLLRALKKGYRVCEFPIEWRSDPDSRVLPLRMARKVFSELIQIKKMMK